MDEKNVTAASWSKDDSSQDVSPVEMSKDEHHLATLGYRQVFIRSFGLFENWAATFTTMNFVSGEARGFDTQASKPRC
jgi:hypothetical protein